MTCGKVTWSLDFSGVVINIEATIVGDSMVFNYALAEGQADLLGLYLDFFNDGGPINSLDGGNNMNGSTADGTQLDGFDVGFIIGTAGAGNGVTTSGSVSMTLAALAGFGITGATEELILQNLAGTQLGIRATSVVADDPAISSLKLAELGTYCPPPPPPDDVYCFTGLTRGAWGTPTEGAGIWDDRYTTTQSTEALFGIDVKWQEPGKGKPVLNDLTLLQAVNFNGGGQNQFIAQSVAAFLNAADSASSTPELGEDGFRFKSMEIYNAVRWAFGLNADIDGDGDIDVNARADNVYNATIGNALASTFDYWNNASHHDANGDGIEDGCTEVSVPHGTAVPSLFSLMGADAFWF